MLNNFQNSNKKVIPFSPPDISELEIVKHLDLDGLLQDLEQKS